MKPFMLCRERREEARKTGLVVSCSSSHHNCKTRRVPYRWLARGDDGTPFISRQPHCGSCIADEDYYGGRDSTTSCCCVHGMEYARRAGEGR